MDKQKNISKLHFITPQYSDDSFYEMLEGKCKQGADWVQLRQKDLPREQIIELAIATKEICKKHGATFLMNDYVDIAQEVNADGVHLGKKDMSPDEARKILGSDKIIGGTANTFGDIERLAKAGADYIGLGPFRFTTTKKNLSPILGLAGYELILDSCNDTDIHIPIIAIGGIEVEDIQNILKTGVHGIAACGLIHKSEEKELHTIFHSLNLSFSMDDL